MRRLAALLAASIAIVASARADAYCRSAACVGQEDGSTDGHVCNPPQDDDCGIPLQWRQPCVGFNVGSSASSQVSYADAEVTLTLALAAWTDVECGAGPPSITVYPLGEVGCETIEYNQHAGNANTLIFQDQLWPHETDDGLGTADTLALTTVTYDVEKGDIYDADIEVNTANNHFTTTEDPGPDDVDLLSVLTHEAGHFLGLSHSAEDATMFPDYTRGTTSIRVLSPDDQAAICVVYPPNRKPVGECTGIPRHGFAPECGDDQTYVQCAAAPGGSSASAAWVLAAVAITARLGSRGWSRSRRGTPRCRDRSRSRSRA